MVGTAADTLQALTVGTDGYTLVADSGETTGLKWAAPAGGGKVLQVVFASTTTQASSSSSTYADTNLTATITPSAATSKVLIIVSQNGLFRSNGSSTSRLGLKLLQNANVIATFASYSLFTNSTLELNGFGLSVNYLDTPNTTSAITYKTQFASTASNASVSVQQNNEISTIALLEIGA